MKKFKFLIILVTLITTALAQNATIESFNTLPISLKNTAGSPSILLSLSKSNIIKEQGKCLRLTTKYDQNPAILKYTLPSKLNNAAKYQAITFYIKSDTHTQLEIAIEDNKMLHPFENINNYIASKQMKRKWQYVYYPLRPKILNKNNIKHIYFKIITNKKNKKEILYIDELAFTNNIPLKKIEKASLKLYDFNTEISNIFSAEPLLKYNNPASINISLNKNEHIGKAGQSLKILANTKDSTNTSIVFPIKKRLHPFDAKKYGKIFFYFKTIPLTPLKINILYKKNTLQTEKYYLHKTTEYKIKAKDIFWKKLSLKLDKEQKEELTGFELIIPRKYQGKIFLDEIHLE